MIERSPALLFNPVHLLTPLPARRGWHRLTIRAPGTNEVIELRLDFGLGFVGHHGVRAMVRDGSAQLFVRLFKSLRGVRMVSRSVSHADQTTVEVSFEPLSSLEVSRRRLFEQLQLLIHSASDRWRTGRGAHDRPRPLWVWTGFQAFPTNVPAKGKSSYALWRLASGQPTPKRPKAPRRDWLAAMDCSRSTPDDVALRSFVAAAEYAGARATFIRENDGALVVSNSVNSPANEPGVPLCDFLSEVKWVLVLEPDVVLDQGSIEAFATADGTSDAVLLYSDSDRRDSRGARHQPEFRTDFSIERLANEDWLGGAVAFRADALAEVLHSGKREGCPVRYRWSLGLAGTSASESPKHVPAVLYSRTAQSQTRLSPSKAARAHGNWATRTTVIIPTRDRGDLLKRCVDSILDRTRPAAPEIIIYDNASGDPATLSLIQEYASAGILVIRDDRPFNFGRINNEAAAQARGDILVFLNNDTEVVSPDWIDQLASVASAASVGSAGALLLKQDGRIQHAGLVTGPGGIAAHVHEGLRPEAVDPAVPIVRRDVSALTGACLAIQKSKFDSVGGFDEDLSVSFNDVDLCLRLEEQGLRNVFVPEATLIHLGSATREDDDFTRGSERFREEFRLMREKWGSRLDSDPYFPDQMRLTRGGPQLRLA